MKHKHVWRKVGMTARNDGVYDDIVCRICKQMKHRKRKCEVG